MDRIAGADAFVAAGQPDDLQGVAGVVEMIVDGRDVGEDVCPQVGVVGGHGGVQRQGEQVPGGVVPVGVEGGPGGEGGQGAEGGVQPGAYRGGHGRGAHGQPPAQQPDGDLVGQRSAVAQVQVVYQGGGLPQVGHVALADVCRGPQEVVDVAQGPVVVGRRWWRAEDDRAQGGVELPPRHLVRGAVGQRRGDGLGVDAHAQGAFVGGHDGRGDRPQAPFHPGQVAVRQRHPALAAVGDGPQPDVGVLPQQPQRRPGHHGSAPGRPARPVRPSSLARSVAPPASSARNSVGRR
jgi:hypothetical protein